MISLNVDRNIAERMETADQIEYILNGLNVSTYPWARDKFKQLIKQLRGLPVDSFAVGAQITKLLCDEKFSLLCPDTLTALLKRGVELVENPVGSDSGCFRQVIYSDLHLNDRFIKEHRPAEIRELHFKEYLVDVISGHRSSDFWVPTIDPSYTGYAGKLNSAHGLDHSDNVEAATPISGELFYRNGFKKFVGLTFDWWEAKANDFAPEHGSRIATEWDYVAFCGDLIKNLVESEGWSVADAWHVVCSPSYEIFKQTEICSKYGVTKNAKAVKDTSEYAYRDYCIVGGAGYPISKVFRVSASDSFALMGTVGLIVLDENPV